ncbi:MAG: glycosyltransferase [Elusimicrobia bacterium]|nr:glycosyltransferase [Elusimicrobiota bacterium]
MRVLLIAGRFPPQQGGAAAAAGRLALSLGESLERLDVLLLDPSLPPGSARGEAAGKARVHRLGPAPREDESSQLLFEAALALAKDARADLIHGFYAFPAGYIAVLAAKRLGLPSVVSLRGNDVDRDMFRAARQPLLCWTLANADAVAGVSSELLERAKALTGRLGGLHLTPNGVDPLVFSPGSPDPADVAALGQSPRPWVGFAGEGRFKKGLSILCSLAEDFARRESGTVFLIGGARDEERAGLARWRGQHPQASPRLVEVGYKAETPALVSHYRAMDLFVFPSLWEGMPNALLEAMACARPVVASAAGAIPEMLGDTGVVLPISDLHRLPEAVQRVLALPEPERKALGEASRRRVQSFFSPTLERDTLLSVYNGVRHSKLSETEGGLELSKVPNV